jgi:hypothetical protein
MNSTNSIFKNEISIVELGNFFTEISKAVSNSLSYPSCIGFGSIKK